LSGGLKTQGGTADKYTNKNSFLWRGITSISYMTRKLRKGIRQTLDKNADMNWTWGSITQNIKTRAREILGYCK
jgi:hypothetical protein